jgi:hypothetical protein
MSARQSIQCVEIQGIRLIRLQHRKLQHVGRTIGSTGEFVKVSGGGGSMDALAKRLDKNLQEWSSEVAEQVRCEVVELIELTNRCFLDSLGRARWSRE